MADNEDPRVGAMRNRGQQKLDKLYEPVLQATRRGLEGMGVSEQQAMETALRVQNGFELLESAGVDQLAREASDGNKESAKTYDEWYCHTFPNSRAQRAALMPHIVGRIPDVRLGPEGGRPLTVRFAELRERAMREIAPDDTVNRSALGLYESEANFDLLHAAIEDSKRRRAPAPPDPRLTPTIEKLEALKGRYRTAYSAIVDTQKKFAFLAETPRHKIVDLLPPDWAEPPLELAADTAWPDISSIDQANELIVLLEPMVAEIEAKLAGLQPALLFEAEQPTDRVQSQVDALYLLHIVKLQHQVDAVRQELHDLKHPPKKRRTRKAAAKKRRLINSAAMEARPQ